MMSRAGRPVSERGRFGRIMGAVADYTRTAWWGLARPAVSEKEPLRLVQAVIERGDEATEILLSLRSDLFGWELPGGTVEAEESLEEALCREVREETGLVVRIEGRVGRWTRTGFRPHQVDVYRCRAVGGVLTPSLETPRLAWTRVDALPIELFSWYRAPIAEALAGGAPQHFCEHQGLSVVLAAARIDLALRWRGLPPQRPEG